MNEFTDLGSERTDFLFAQPTWLSGIARLLDLFGGFDRYNTSPPPGAADTVALHSDWAVIGKALRDGTKAFEAENPRR